MERRFVRSASFLEKLVAMNATKTETNIELKQYKIIALNTIRSSATKAYFECKLPDVCT